MSNVIPMPVVHRSHDHVEIPSRIYAQAIEALNDAANMLVGAPVNSAAEAHLIRDALARLPESNEAGAVIAIAQFELLSDAVRHGLHQLSLAGCSPEAVAPMARAYEELGIHGAVEGLPLESAAQGA